VSGFSRTLMNGFARLRLTDIRVPRFAAVLESMATRKIIHAIAVMINGAGGADSDDYRD
jgi:hypothetical protein